MSVVLLVVLLLVGVVVVMLVVVCRWSAGGSRWCRGGAGAGCGGGGGSGCGGGGGGGGGSGANGAKSYQHVVRIAIIQAVERTGEVISTRMTKNTDNLGCLNMWPSALDNRCIYVHICRFAGASAAEHNCEKAPTPNNKNKNTRSHRSTYL